MSLAWLNKGLARFAQQLGQQADLSRRATEDFGMDLARARQQGQKKLR